MGLHDAMSYSLHRLGWVLEVRWDTAYNVSTFVFRYVCIHMCTLNFVRWDVSVALIILSLI